MTKDHLLKTKEEQAGKEETADPNVIKVDYFFKKVEDQREELEILKVKLTSKFKSKNSFILMIFLKKLI